MPRWRPFEEHFWALVDKTDSCWWWRGGRYGNGYGRVHYKGARHPAHRVAVALSKDGALPPPEFDVCHTCDHTLCVRPDHLFIGTKKENMQDSARKGRNIMQRHPERARFGENHPGARLTAAQVATIRERWDRGGTTKIALAQEHGVTDVLVGLIVRRRAWRRETA